MSKITVKAYVVAANREQAESFVSGTYNKYGKPWGSTVSSLAVARLVIADIRRVPSNPKQFAFPVTATFDVGEAVTRKRKHRAGG